MLLKDVTLFSALFREFGGARCVHNIVKYRQCREHALLIIQQLVLSPSGDDDMGTLLGLMHSAPPSELQLKTDILRVRPALRGEPSGTACCSSHAPESDKLPRIRSPEKGQQDEAGNVKNQYACKSSKVTASTRGAGNPTCMKTQECTLTALIFSGIITFLDFPPLNKVILRLSPGFHRINLSPFFFCSVIWELSP